MRILITRPYEYALPLAEKLIRLNFDPIIFPTIEIGPHSDQTQLLENLKALTTVDLVIFSSRAAVQYGTDAIKAAQSPLNAKAWVALGPGTAKELKNCHYSPIVSPLRPPYESEALFNLAEFKDLQQKKVVIFRGQDGRAFLPKTLEENGALVQIIECYERRIPKYNDKIERRIPKYGDRIEDLGWHLGPIDAIISTSSESLSNLKIMLGQKLWQQLYDIPIIVVGKRMQQLASQLGIQKIILAEGANDTAVIQALLRANDTAVVRTY